jgi:hypothetical protein
MWKQSPYEKRYKLQPLVKHSSGWALYWKLDVTQWDRACWRFPEDDSWWYMIGPFAFAIDSYCKWGSRV